MILDHIVDAEPCRPLLARLGQEDHIPVEFDFGALQQQHQHQRGSDIVLIVEGPAAIHVPILDDGGERIDGPVIALHADYVGVAHDQNRPLAAVATMPRKQVRARRVEREELGLDAFLLEYSLKIRCGFGFVAGRIAGIRTQQCRKIFHRFRGNGRPIYRITILRIACERSHRQAGAE